jgi:hypothetical protein
VLLARLLELPQGNIERHQALLERVDGCLGAVCQLQFGEDIGDMGLDCLLSKDEFNSNLVIRAAMCKVGEDLQFARREFIQEYLARLLHFA